MVTERNRGHGSSLFLPDAEPGDLCRVRSSEEGVLGSFTPNPVLLQV